MDRSRSRGTSAPPAPVGTESGRADPDRTGSDAPPPRRWWMLALLSAAQFFGMSLWFTASAVAPQLSEMWSLSPQEAAWLTTVVQMGFVAGTAAAALLNLADIVPARPYFAVSALLGGVVNGLVAVAPGYETALVLRFMTGFFLAGVYPPAMKMVATWFLSGRGVAIGTVVGALTLGKATPFLTRAFEAADFRIVVLTASVGAVVAAGLVAAGYREGPYPFSRRPFSWKLVRTVLRHRPTRLATAGYLGHMWELYAMWTLVTIFFRDFFLFRGHGNLAAISYSSFVGFSVIGVGALGCVLAGAWADRMGRERIAIWALAISGACSLTMGWLLAAPTAVVVTLALVWGFAVVADSAQFSALVTEVAPSHAVGTALTLQTSLGFLLTAGSIWLTVELSGRFGWGPAFSLLAIGPAFGIVSMLRLKNTRPQASPKIEERV